MKAKPLRIVAGGFEKCSPDVATHIRLHMPGPFPNRILPVMIGGRREGTPNWTWNGSCDLPTIKPSILTTLQDDCGKQVCHSWVNDGKAIFLNDSTHEFSGQTVDLLEID
jgi:hypothetical protein